jgi:hypothetical protein
MTTSLLHFASTGGMPCGSSGTKLLACLEGGYSPLGLAKSVEAVLQSLLDDCCGGPPSCNTANGGPSTRRLSEMAEWLSTADRCDAGVVQVIDEVRALLAPHWSCFR